MRMIGYDTFGPQYPPQWDEPEIPECDRCGDPLVDDHGDLNQAQIDTVDLCPDCYQTAQELVSFFLILWGIMR